jgi:uncharacterized protein
MTRRTSYEPGTPCWVDLVTPDTAATTAFYTGLFGWRAGPTPGSAVPGHTTLTLADEPGRPVAALMPHVAAAPPGTPALWTTYVSVADVDRSAAAVRAAGGQVFMGPADVPGQGRFALLFDPHGAHLGLWQADGFAGAGITDEPGTYCWSELTTRETGRSAEFYEAVLGWETVPEPTGTAAMSGVGRLGAGARWRTAGGRPVAGMALLPGDRSPTELPPLWQVYFAVTDCDATAARAVELGGSAATPPADTDTPAGRCATLTDPRGGRFSIIQRSD